VISAPPPESVKRGLVLIGKILQNLSNEQRFKEQEDFMSPINVFITENVPKLKEAFQKLAVSLLHFMANSLCRTLFPTGTITKPPPLQMNNSWEQ
jgi:hypothetical protein